jgi:hypothetical protein
MKLVFDVWGGEGNQEHLARTIQETSPIDLDALLVRQVAAELAGGYLVNLRPLVDDQVAWGPSDNFDLRTARSMQQ